MRAFILAFVVLFWAPHMTTWASTYDTFAPESSTRSANATVDFIENNRKAFWPFQVELGKNTSFSWGQVRIAREQGKLLEFLCGDCVCRTAGLLPDGRVVYHRFLRPDEKVAVVGDKAVFVVKCGNPLVCTSAPWMKPAPLPTPPPPTPVAVEKPPEEPRIGCTDGSVQYSMGYWQNPGIGGWFGSSGHGYSWTNSHHDGVECVWDSNSSEGER